MSSSSSSPFNGSLVPARLTVETGHYVHVGVESFVFRDPCPSEHPVTRADVRRSRWSLPFVSQCFFLVWLGLFLCDAPDDTSSTAQIVAQTATPSTCVHLFVSSCFHMSPSQAFTGREPNAARPAHSLEVWMKQIRDWQTCSDRTRFSMLG